MLIISGGAAFGLGLSNPFVFDDRHIIVQNSWLQLSFIRHFFWSFVNDSNLGFPGYRPLVMATFAIQRHYTELDPFYFRLGNLILHILNSFLVFYLTEHLLKPFFRTTSSIGAWIVALGFLVHPVQTNVIALVWKRTDLLVTFGILVSLLSFYRWLDTKRSSSLIGIFVGSWIASSSKESALILPFAMIGLSFIWTHAPIKKRVIGIVAGSLYPLMLAFLLFAVMPGKLEHIGLQAETFRPPSLWYTRTEYAMTQMPVLIRYLRILILPTSLQVFHWIPKIDSFANSQFLIGALVFFAAIALAFVSWNRYRWISISIAWFILFLLPASSLIPLELPIDEDRLYLPIIGVFLFLAGAILHFEVRLPNFSARPFLLMALVLYISVDIFRLRVWSHEIDLWKDNVSNEPKDPRAWVTLGQAYADAGAYQTATKCFERATRIEPNYGAPYFFSGFANVLAGHPQQATENFEQAIRRDTMISASLSGLANIAVSSKDRGRAMRYWLLAFYRNLSEPVTYRNISKALEDENQIKPSVRALEKALDANPSDPETELRLAYALWKYERRKDLALELVRSSQRQVPNDPRISKMLEEMDSP